MESGWWFEGKLVKKDGMLRIESTTFELAVADSNGSGLGREVAGVVVALGLINN